MKGLDASTTSCSKQYKGLKLFNSFYNVIIGISEKDLRLRKIDIRRAKILP